MSLASVEAFYLRLDRDKVLREEALSLKRHTDSQEELMERFAQLGAREGYEFTLQDLVTHLYRTAEPAASDAAPDTP